MGYWGFAPYVSVARKKAKAERLINKLNKKGKNLEPVSIAGTKIAKQWWGKSWNENLERYADYSNRIGRGRSYVRHGMVIDLKIDKGNIQTLVAGTGSQPYKVSVKIDTLSKKQWNDIVSKTEGRIDSIQELLAGSFPKDFQNIFIEKGKGLFPPPKEIHFSCSCPDWAYMCKHVAATLYAVGARLDTKPELFFTLRGVNMEELAGKVLEQETSKILKATKTKSKRKLALADEGLSELFGVDVSPAGFKEEKVKDKKKRKKISRKAAVKKVSKKKAVKKAVSRKKADRKTVAEKTTLSKNKDKKVTVKKPAASKNKRKKATVKKPAASKDKRKKVAVKKSAVSKDKRKKVVVKKSAASKKQRKK